MVKIKPAKWSGCAISREIQVADKDEQLLLNMKLLNVIITEIASSFIYLFDSIQQNTFSEKKPCCLIDFKNGSKQFYYLFSLCRVDSLMFRTANKTFFLQKLYLRDAYKHWAQRACNKL